MSNTTQMLNSQTLLVAYRRMKLIRQFEERVRMEFESGKIPGFIHLYVGQEASAVGVCLNLKDSDWIASTHRGHGHCLAKGCEVSAMMREIFGKRGGLCGGKGGSMHIAEFERGMLGANAIVGANAPLIVGAALAAKTLGNDGVAVSFIGDGGTNQGSVFESLNMAVVLHLPALFVFENNGFGEMTSCDYAVGSKDIAARAAAFGLPAIRVDGTDFFEVHAAAGEAVRRARAGEGPSVIETVARRWHGHYSGDPQNYRSKTERAQLAGADPIEKMRGRLVAEYALEHEMSEIDEEVVRLVDEAVRDANTESPPAPGDLLTDVYVSY